MSLPLRERKMWSSPCEVIANATAQNKENVGGALRARCPVCSLMLRSQNVPGFSSGGDRAEVPQKLHERSAFLLHSLFFCCFSSYVGVRGYCNHPLDVQCRNCETASTSCFFERLQSSNPPDKHQTRVAGRRRDREGKIRFAAATHSLGAR